MTRCKLACSRVDICSSERYVADMATQLRYIFACHAPETYLQLWSIHLFSTRAHSRHVATAASKPLHHGIAANAPVSEAKCIPILFSVCYCKPRKDTYIRDSHTRVNVTSRSNQIERLQYVMNWNSTTIYCNNGISEGSFPRTGGGVAKRPLSPSAEHGPFQHQVTR